LEEIPGAFPCSQGEANPYGFRLCTFRRCIMDPLFKVPDLGSLSVEMDGMVVLNEGRGNYDFFCSYFEPWRKKGAAIEKTTNHVEISGHQSGVEVKVFEHLYRDRRMEELIPYLNRDGVKKFFSENDVYIVLAAGNDKQMYVIAHRLFPFGKVNWDTLECRRLPAEIGKRPDKPLSQPLDLSSIPEPKPTNDGDNGHKPSDELDQATKDALAGEQLNGASKPRGSRKPRETRPEIK